MKKMILVAGLITLMAAGCGNTRQDAEVTAVSSVAETAAVEKETTEAAVEKTEAKMQDVTLRNTAYGPVQGVEEGEVLIWHGVPYGKEPSGSLRWAAPEDPEPWTEAYDATDWKEAAMQLSGEEVTGTENCLNLDIYSTKNAEKLPVLVFLHGGNNQTGNTKEIIGSDMVVKNDMVFVSVNYRLGLLGFNCLPALQTEAGSTGNYALLDIAKSLDWVKDNIAEFGGDPENITISGFSAGGRDVMAMLISPVFEGKFQKAIAFSGGMTVADEELSAAKIAKAIAPLAVEDKKAADEASAEAWLLGTGEDVKEYLYSISSERLCRLMGNAGIRMSVFPHLYADDVLLPKDGFSTERYNDVPLLMLTGTSEFSMFALGDAYYGSEEMAGLSEQELQAAKDFAVRYGSRMYGYFNAEASAERMWENYESPIYLCSVHYGGPGSQYPIPEYGSFHGVFVPMLARENNYAPMMPGTFDTPAYVDMAEVFNGYLKNFLYTGDPNGTGLSVWQAWEPETHLSLVLDGMDDRALVDCRAVTESYQGIMDEMDADTSISADVKEKVIAHVMNGRWFSDALDDRYGNEDLWK